MPAPYRCLVSRAVCKRCAKPNDREFDGSLGGQFCNACISERRRAGARLWRAKVRDAILARGRQVCRCGRYAIVVGGKVCAGCAALIQAKAAAIVEAVPVLGADSCKRCYLRGPHECLTGLETRRSSWANMERL